MGLSKKNETKLRTLICEDHGATLRGIRHQFQEEGFEVVKEVTSLDDLLNYKEAIKDSRANPIVYVLDLNLRDVHGVTALKKFLAHQPDAIVVVHSARTSLSIIGACYGAGAKAYVPKDAPDHYLVDAVKAASENQVLFLPGIAEALAMQSVRPEFIDPTTVLTPREKEIFVLLSMGNSIREVANKLGLMERTVSNKAQDIRGKLKIKRTQFRQVAIQYNLIEEND